MTVTHWLASCSLLCHTLVWKHFWKNWFHSSKRNSLFLLFQPLMRNTYLYLPKWKESGFLWWWRFIKDHNHTSLCIFKELKYIFSISLLITGTPTTNWIPALWLRFEVQQLLRVLSTKHISRFLRRLENQDPDRYQEILPHPHPPTHKPSSRKIRQSGEGWYDVIGWGWWVRLHS